MNHKRKNVKGGKGQANRRASRMMRRKRAKADAPADSMRDGMRAYRKGIAKGAAPALALVAVLAGGLMTFGASAQDDPQSLAELRIADAPCSELERRIESVDAEILELMADYEKHLLERMREGYPATSPDPATHQKTQMALARLLSYQQRVDFEIQRRCW